MKNLIAQDSWWNDTTSPDIKIKNPALGPNLSNILQDEGGIGFFQKLLPSLVGLGFLIGVIIFFFMIVLGGIQWIASGGDKAAVEGARGKLLNAIIGIIVLFSVFAIIKLIEEFFGVNILALDIGPLKIE